MKTKFMLNHLVKQMKKLEKSEIDCNEAMTHATLVRQSVNILRYELERAKTLEGISGEIRDIG